MTLGSAVNTFVVVRGRLEKDNLDFVNPLTVTMIFTLVVCFQPFYCGCIAPLS